MYCPKGFKCSLGFCAMMRSHVGNSAPSTPLRFNSAFLNAANEFACARVSKKLRFRFPASRKFTTKQYFRCPVYFLTVIFLCLMPQSLPRSCRVCKAKHVFCVFSCHYESHG